MPIIYVDISAYQQTVDWPAYIAWRKEQGNPAIAAIKATEGVGFVDQSFTAHRQGALDAGIDMLIYYGFARPDLHNNPVDEANFLFHTVGAIRSQDLIMLDMEIVSSADWSYQWLTQQQQNYGGKLPVLYSYDSFIRSHLQDERLKQFPLIVANYTYDANARPQCPPPWTEYLAIQYTDKATIPGIATPVDANVWLGKEIDNMSIDIHTPGVSDVFTEQDANHWLYKISADKTLVVHDAMLAYYKQNNGLTTLGTPISSELELGGGKSKQYFMFGCLNWNGSKVVPAPVYRSDKNTPVLGEDPLIVELTTELAQASTDTTATTKLAQIKAIVEA